MTSKEVNHRNSFRCRRWLQGHVVVRVTAAAAAIVVAVTLLATTTDAFSSTTMSTPLAVAVAVRTRTRTRTRTVALRSVGAKMGIPLLPDHCSDASLLLRFRFRRSTSTSTSTSTSRMALALGAGRQRRDSTSASPGSGSDPSGAGYGDGNDNDDDNDDGYGDVRGATRRRRLNINDREELARRKRIGELERRLRRAARRDHRISVLEAKIALHEQDRDEHEHEHEQDEQQSSNATAPVTDAERAELQGLLRVRAQFEEQYDATEFTDEHLRFKDLHNDAFVRLIRYCEEQQQGDDSNNSNSSSSSNNSNNVFFLDGPDGRTGSALIRDGNLDPDRCFVANRHESTCASLRRSGGGLLPDSNVVHATASEALSKAATTVFTGGDDLQLELELDSNSESNPESQQQQGALAHVSFQGYYFDGCAGFAPLITNMMSSALLRLEGDDDENDNGDDGEEQRADPRRHIVVGYSLIGGGSQKSHSASMVENELFVTRALTTIAKTRGMRVCHALDDPERYGLDPKLPKVVGNTFTTWLILEPGV